MPKTKATKSKSTPTKARVTFSDTTPSTPGTNTSSNTETPSGSLIDAADDICYTETFNKVFSKKLLAILTGKDAILKEVRDCVILDDPDRLCEISPCIFSYWRVLSVKHGSFCLDERIAIPKAIKDAVLEDIHSTHPGNFAMLSIAQNIWWPYIHRDKLAKISECKACSEFCKNVKPVIPLCKWALLSKYPTAEVVKNTSSTNVIKFLNIYIYNHGVPRTIRLDQARCFTEKKVETFCTENNITPTYAPANDHRATDLVERLIQTIKRQLSSMKTQLNKKFNLEHSLYAIIQRVRISKQKKIDITPFEAHLGRKSKRPISNITTKPNNKNLNYNKIIKHYLHEVTIPGRSYLTEEQWADTALCSDTEIEKVICAANARANKKEDKMKDVEPQLIWSEATNLSKEKSRRAIRCACSW